VNPIKRLWNKAMTQGGITEYTHPDYDRFAPLWRKVRDVCAGEDAIKACGTRYLPNPSDENDAMRYRRYVERAVFFNATGRTLQGLIGIAFGNWPIIAQVDSVLLDAPAGPGVTLIGQAQGVLADVLQTGRAGLLADWTRGDGIKRRRTVAEAEAAGARPFVAAYSPESILTWELVDGTLSRVVLRETAELHEAGQVIRRDQLRELVLENGRYLVKLWQRVSEMGSFYLIDRIDTGLGFIPFQFVGAVNNDPAPDMPPLLDLANLNLAHYRNSADYEESAFLMGQPMLVMTGVTEEWVEKAGAIRFGARVGLPLPADGDAKLLQAAPNTLAKEAMLDKERLMALIGARLLESPGAKTATQSAAETRAAYAPLSLACDNVSQAYTQVLRWAQHRAGASFDIDTRFGDITLDANAIRETVAAWQAGLVPQSDAVTVLQRLGVIDQGKTAEQVAGEVEGQGPGLELGAAA